MYANADQCGSNLRKIDEFAQLIKDCRLTHHSTANCSLKSIQEFLSRSEVKGAPSPIIYEVMKIFDPSDFSKKSILDNDVHGLKIFK